MEVKTGDDGELIVSLTQEDRDNFKANYGISVEEAWSRIDRIWLGTPSYPFMPALSIKAPKGIPYEG